MSLQVVEAGDGAVHKIVHSYIVQSIRLSPIGERKVFYCMSDSFN